MGKKILLSLLNEKNGDSGYANLGYYANGDFVPLKTYYFKGNKSNFSTYVYTNNLSKLRSVAASSLAQFCYYSSNITLETDNIEFSNLETIEEYGCSYAFNGLSGKLNKTDGTKFTSVSFPKLTTIANYGLQYGFYSCSSLKTISFPELTTVKSNGLYYAFNSCTNLTSVSFPKLSTVDSYVLQYAFRNCTGLTSISFPELTTIGSYALYNTFYECEGLTEVHFHYSLKGNSQCTASYMGCSNATVYFDLGSA